MRAQCCICADLFENSATVNIAAAPCGHTFHEACLMRWMTTSSTCPSCRTHVKKNQIIKRLFFDICETEGEGPDEDICRLTNQVANAKAQLGEAEKERDILAAQLFECEQERADLKKKHNSERNVVEVLQRDFALLQRENAVYAEGMKDYKKTLEKMEKLKNVDTILKGCDSDIQAMISQYSEGGDSSLRQLCSLVTVMKREYTQALAAKKQQREEISKLKTIISRRRKQEEDLQKSLADVTAMLDESNSSLSQMEKENNLNRRKVSHLRKALRHKVTDGSTSFIQALNDDSPNVAYTPPRRMAVSAERNDQENSPMLAAPEIQTPFSPDLFDSPTSEDNSEPQGLNPDRGSPKLKLFKVATASEKFLAAKKAKTDTATDCAPAAPMLNILKKKLTGLSNSRSHVTSVSRRDYDGFGGSTTFVQPVGPPKSALMRMGLKKKTSKSSRLMATKPLANQLKLSNCLYNGTFPSSSTSSHTTSASGADAKQKRSLDDDDDDVQVVERSEKPWRAPMSVKVKKPKPSATSTSCKNPQLTMDTTGFIDLT
ncbi:E3 ubiquitin-protein ligase TRAIP [Aplysia californica]|uniref:E3 ubiquitin-protein ligase TRAIP n=1 Tax=Aplysia californica TaxID=6500 RepID=A0ABM1VWP8_APLCA|nr:E3 ubiquitin-protein ligase TRAIP [Aplysia californica]